MFVVLKVVSVPLTVKLPFISASLVTVILPKVGVPEVPNQFNVTAEPLLPFVINSA